ncbi:FUSC family protein [Streptomyces sp. CA-181903]|uniref:FUSC family protein n=1 Tax=Streptomyces sp. CA-181903 TaxID=3240055 RepID=UPI003D9131C3
MLFRNALRLSLALACARLLVGVLELPHGFWVLLAILSLMRTSAADTRAALVPGVVGTVVGGVLATGMLLAADGTTAFYAAFTPVFLLVGLTVGPVLGPAWTQGVVTVALVLIFGQVAPPDWDLPAVRLLTVLIGGGSARWRACSPGPGRGRTTAARHRPVPDPGRRGVPGRHRPARPPGRRGRGGTGGGAAGLVPCAGDLPPVPHGGRLAGRPGPALGGVHAARVRGGRRRRHDARPAPGRRPPAAAGRRRRGVGRAGGVAAAGCLAAAEALRSGRAPGDAGGTPAAEASGALRWAAGHASSARVADVLLVADAEAWLAGVVRDAGAARG